MAKLEPEPRVVDGETFCIGPSMLLDPVVSSWAKLCVGAVPLLAVGAFGLRSLCWALLLALLLPYAVNGASKQLSARFAAIAVPRVMALIDARFAAVRREQLKGIKGRVLDVGAGGGGYLKYLAARGSGVTELVELEPNVHLHSAIRRTIAEVSPLPFPVSVVGEVLEDMRGDRSFDSILLGNVLCEIPDVGAALAEMDRLLKEGGRVYFCEHIRSSGWLGAVQDCLNWWWVTVSDGCNCNRRTLEVIQAQPSWSVAHWAFPAAVAMPLIQDFIVGIAVKECRGSTRAFGQTGTTDAADSGDGAPPHMSKSSQGGVTKRATARARARKHLSLSYDET